MPMVSYPPAISSSAILELIMRSLRCAALMAGFWCGSAIADSCWTVTDMKGKAASARSDYQITDDGFSKSTFFLHINSKSPYIEILESSGAYGSGRFLMMSDEMLLFLSTDLGSTAEVWSVDSQKHVVYMTKSNAGYGQFNKAAMFIGKAVPGC